MIRAYVDAAKTLKANKSATKTVKEYLSVSGETQILNRWKSENKTTFSGDFGWI